MDEVNPSVPLESENNKPHWTTAKKYKTILLISLCVAALVIGGAIAAKRFAGNRTTVTTTTKKSATATATPVVSTLDGMPYAEDKAKRHPLAVVIENHPDARPQFSLSSASLVYEAITEGGITRYLAIFGPQDAKEIGPIRSARLFFMDWVKEYDAFFAHAGGNEDALANIDAYNIKDLPHTGNYFWRDNKGKPVASEHTLFSSTEKLYAFANDKKFDVNSSNFTALKFKKDSPGSASGKSVEIDFSSASYKVKWAYDPNTNAYTRYLAGKEDKDALVDKNIVAKNIIIQTVERTLQPTGSYGSTNYVFKTVGSGPAYVVRDGQEIKGTWKKNDLSARTIFYDETDREIEFNPGQTWYEIVPPEVTAQFI